MTFGFEIYGNWSIFYAVYNYCYLLSNFQCYYLNYGTVLGPSSMSSGVGWTVFRQVVECTQRVGLCGMWNHLLTIEGGCQSTNNPFIFILKLFDGSFPRASCNLLNFLTATSGKLSCVLDSRCLKIDIFNLYCVSYNLSDLWTWKCLRWVWSSPHQAIKNILVKN